MKRKILTMMRQADQYVSGQEICDQLGVSRTAVWKAVNGLKAEGYEIEAVQNKGYHLVSYPDVLTVAEVGSLRQDIWKDQPLQVYAQTDSTNNQARALAEAGSPEGTLVIADLQTNGKGRRGRQWETLPGTNIAMSLVLKPEFEPSKASMLTILAALAGAKGVQELTGEDVKIKWPNDLVLNGKKICGILTEMNLEADYIQQVIVGIGLNVNNESFPVELKDKATSLYLETGKKYSRAMLVSLIWKHFGTYYHEFVQKENLGFIVEEYNNKLVSRDGQVRILTPREDWQGTSLGITETGGLLVQDSQGKIHEIVAGEVSVRGLYQYV